MMHTKSQKWISAFLAVLSALTLSACGGHSDPHNLISQEETEKRIINLFSPMEKTDPDAENVARTASDLTVIMAEEALGATAVYRTYTAEDYQEKTYDEVCLDRARNNMDDLYLLNPDTIQMLGSEGLLMDLSGLESTKNLRDIVRTANTVDGKLVAIPQEVVAYGLFINKSLFIQYGLSLPETPEEFLECCRVFRKTALKPPSGPTAGGWRPLFLRRLTQICIMVGTPKRRLRPLTAGQSATAIICVRALSSCKR